MKRYITYILTLLAILFTACEGYAPLPTGKSHSIVVLHSYDRTGEEGEPFTNYMKKAFCKEGINADIHHIYMDATKVPHGYIDINTWQAEIDSILKCEPELILANGDYTLNFILEESDSTANNDTNQMNAISEMFRTTPVVFAGVNALEASRLKQHPNITGFEDIIDIQHNIIFYNKVAKKLNVTIELDHFHLDSILRNRIYEQISDSNLFINNGDFHVISIDEKDLLKQHPKTPVVNFISVADPETNLLHMVVNEEKRDMYEYPNSPIDQRWIIPGEEVLKSLMVTSANNGHIQVKYDIYSNTLIDHGSSPQFTAIRTQFNNPQFPRFVGGYFSSMETQIDDQVRYAAKILRGKNPKDMLVGEHAPEYYMDYNAMQQFIPEPLEYKDWYKQATILNAPFEVAHPEIYICLIVLAIVAGILIVIFGLYHLMVVSNRDEHTSLHIMEREYIRRNLLMNAHNINRWTLENGIYSIPKAAAEELGANASFALDELEANIAPESKAAFSILKNYGNGEGTQALRLKFLSPSSKKVWHWFEFRFTSTPENVKEKRLSGIAVAINDVVRKEKRLKKLLADKSESDFKQNYLCNISHDIRTPLNAVTGFAQLLTAEGMEFSSEEKEEFTKTINENSDMMMGMIQSVIDRTEFNVKEIQVKPIPTSARDFIMSTYNTLYILTPSHLYLKVENDDMDYTVMMDPNLTRQVINNFVGNAFKFTPQGGITIGYHYLPDTNQVQFFCRDTGIGLTEEDRQQVFDRFYKVNENANGTGLGLNISQNIIKQQGGEIGVDSQFGVGSSFWFKLNIHT